MSLKVPRSQIAAASIALLVLLAGCSGLPGSGAGPATDTDGQTTPANVSTTDETAGDETVTGESNDSDDREAALSGRMLFVVDGQQQDLDTEPDAAFWFNESNEHTWHAEEPMSLAAALETAGVDASADSLTYDGETYNESDENTSITYRVAGTDVEDPSTYELEDLDPAHEIIVHVDTDTEREVPGEKLDQSHPHPHGQLDVTVGGEPVDFTREQYTHVDEYFHFHGDENAERWHSHSLNLTASYAVSTFPGMNLTSDSFTYNGTTYSSTETASSLDVTVNGEEIDPETYVLKDGDSLEISAE